MFAFCCGVGYEGRGVGRMEEASVLCKGKGGCSILCGEKSLFLHFPLILSAFEYKVHCLLCQNRLACSPHVKLDTTFDVIKCLGRVIFCINLHF